MPPALTFRSNLTRPLTEVEGDNNIHNLDERLQTVEADVAAIGAQIAYFEIIGTNLYVHLTDHTRLGPYALPSIDFRGRGVWIASTQYYAADLVTNGGRLFRVLLDHVSDTSFDPNATDGLGHNLYAFWIKFTNPISVKTVTTDTYTFVADDANSYIRFTNAAGCVASLPPGLFTQDDEISVRQTLDSAHVEIVEMSPVMINRVQGHLNITARRGAVVTLKLEDATTNSWDIMGLLAPGSP